MRYETTPLRVFCLAHGKQRGLDDRSEKLPFTKLLLEHRGSPVLHPTMYEEELRPIGPDVLVNLGPVSLAKQLVSPDEFEVLRERLDNPVLLD
jgi:hypothetical protein